MKCKAILVDFDGVLRHWPSTDRILEVKYGLAENSIREAAFENQLLQQAIRGIITDESWRSEIAETLQAAQPDADAHTAVREWSSYAGEIDADLLGLLSSIRSEVEIVLLTNATTRLLKDLEALGLDNWFTNVVNSSAVGVIKPEPEIYQIAIQMCNCSTDEILFIDDSLANTLAAHNSGILSYHYTGVAGCEQYLSEVGLSGIVRHGV